MLNSRNHQDQIVPLWMLQPCACSTQDPRGDMEGRKEEQGADKGSPAAQPMLMRGLSSGES